MVRRANCLEKVVRALGQSKGVILGALHERLESDV